MTLIWQVALGLKIDVQPLVCEKSVSAVPEPGVIVELIPLKVPVPVFVTVSDFAELDVPTA